MRRQPREEAPGGTGNHLEKFEDTGRFLPQYEQLFRRSEKMRAVEQLVRRVADTNFTVLIHGETGVGKELVAKAIHWLSHRSHKPWTKLNCAALPADLLESELFGHEKGAFTGATSRKLGRFELAAEGTFLLDEIAEMPLALQPKILHYVQDHEFFRVGGHELIHVDVRTVAATNKDLAAVVASGSFREDLYYRLNVLNIYVPPLRERREEISSLVEYFREEAERQLRRAVPQLAFDTLHLLMTYSWPGNVRELENLIKRYAVLGEEALLRSELQTRMQAASSAAGPPPVPSDNGAGSESSLREIARRAALEAEQRAIRQVLEAVRWNRTEAARRLKVSYNTLLSKMNELNLGTKRHSEVK